MVKGPQISLKRRLNYPYLKWAKQEETKSVQRARQLQRGLDWAQSQALEERDQLQAQGMQTAGV